MSKFKQNTKDILKKEYGKELSNATQKELYNAVSKAAMVELEDSWRNTEKRQETAKRACYFSAEFLIGKLVYSNLLNLKLLEGFNELMTENGLDIGVFETIEDNALGNGGLGRLAACFLDSAATHDIPLNGYGIRYKYGLFKQYFENGFQKETMDDWQTFGDPWSVKREDLAIKVDFADQSIFAVPYDTPVIGYGGKCINTLRLWEAKAINDATTDHETAEEEKRRAEEISGVLYPNDEGDAGKILRIKQQYFFSSASLQDLVREYKKLNGKDFSRFADKYCVQLNDTHPVVSIPELIRILVNEEGMVFEDAFKVAQKTFAYTNHTILPEALEKWRVELFKSVLPEVYRFIELINDRLVRELRSKGFDDNKIAQYTIIDGNTLHMARLAVYATFSTNGVARIHSNILKDSCLNEWYQLYPERFNNKTNGITQRRFLLMSNQELAKFISEKIGDNWIVNLEDLKQLEKSADDTSVLENFTKIKKAKKVSLCNYIEKKEGIKLNPDFIFDIQVKRLHEYKRQLLNAFSIVDIYFGLKEGRIKNFNPTVFIFGAKAAPGYYRAKGIIKYINEIAKLINNDRDMDDKLKVLFVTNYNVSYAEKLIPAADISEQISTAGTEASGTGNMKFMLNGAVTLGTLDGANVEIVEQAGEENNYIFGAKVEEIEAIRNSYNSAELYNNNARIKRVVDTLIDGTFDDNGTGMFRNLYDALIHGAHWHRADNYFILYDFEAYVDTKLRAIADYSDRAAFAKKCFINMCNAGKFSSDRTIKEYAQDIWHV